jgi:hypothetical protein
VDLAENQGKGCAVMAKRTRREFEREFRRNSIADVRQPTFDGAENFERDVWLFCPMWLF